MLKANRTGAVFLFETGYVQACSSTARVKVTPSETPLTYELFAHIIQATGCRLVAAVVDAFDRNAQTHSFYLVVETPSGRIKIKCRGSDAVGIAHFAGMPVKIDAAFLGKGAASVTRNWRERITIHPAVCDGEPCIRGTQIKVSKLLHELAAGVQQNELLVVQSRPFR